MLEELSWEEFPSWLSPLHVCQTWRAASLSCSQLWRHIPLQSLALTDFALDRTRSKLLPRIVYDSAHGRTSDTALRVALQHPNRIQRLTCRVTKATSAALSAKFSCLKSLCLWISPYQDQMATPEDSDRSRGQLTITLHMLGGRQALERLDELRLHAEYGLWLAPEDAHSP